MKKILILAAHAFLLLPVSCTVKEEREGCPCWLEIDVSACSRHDDVVYLKGWHGKESQMGDKVYLSDYPEIFVKKVNRGSISYRAYMGLNTSSASGNAIIIPEGCESDMLYAYAADINTEGEEAHDRIIPHKQFTAVSMKISGDVSGIAVDGNTSGFDVAEMAPVPGAFHIEKESDGSGEFMFRIPRQKDKELILHVIFDGTIRHTLQLGDIITKTGYDWAAEDLEDIYISINLTGIDTGIAVEVWKSGETYNFIS